MHGLPDLRRKGATDDRTGQNVSDVHDAQRTCAPAASSRGISVHAATAVSAPALASTPTASEICARALTSSPPALTRRIAAMTAFRVARSGITESR